MWPPPGLSKGWVTLAALLGLGGGAFLPATAHTEAEVLRVFTAASTREVIEACAAGYEAQVPGIHVQVHSAGSSTLRRQIEDGAPWQVFISAAAADAEELWQRGLSDAPTRIAGNRLVVCAPADEPPLADLDALAGVSRLVLANPASAPVGAYAQEALLHAGLWPKLASNVVWAEHARHVVAIVAAGGAQAGIAFATDVANVRGVQSCFVVADSLHASIGYWAVAARGSTEGQARHFITQVASSDSLWRARGFDAAPTPPAVAVLRSTQDGLGPLWLSLRVATVATLVAALLGLGVAARLARRRGAGVELAAAFVDLPLVLPPTVVGVALLYLVGPRSPLGRALESIGVQVAFSWGAAVLASSVMALPLMVRAARAALESVPLRYAQAAATLGASPRRVFWTVELPLARHGVLAGVLLTFFRCLGEFGATLIVAGNIPGVSRTLPLAIYTAVFEGRTHQAWQWVAWIAIVSLAGTWWAQRWMRR